MKSARRLRLAFGLLALLCTVPAAAQMRDSENATPRVLPTLVAAPETTAASATQAECHRLLRELTNLLALQPAQVALVRQALALRLGAPAAADASPCTPEPALEPRPVLTAAQLARLQQWEAALPATARLNLMATLH